MAHESMSEAIFYWVYIILITTICVCGIIGNILSLIVLIQKKMESSTTSILIGLTITDTILLITGLMINSIGIIVLKNLYENDQDIPMIAVDLFGFFYPLKRTGNMASVYITVLITIERYIAVCRPLEIKRYFTTKKAAIYTLGAVSFSVIFNIPRWFENWEVELEVKNSSSILDATSTAPLASNYKIYYHGYAWTIFTYVIPFGILLTLNWFIVRRILNKTKTRESLGTVNKISQKKKMKADASITKMLLVIVFAFMICSTGQAICDWIFIITGETTVFSDAIKALLLMTNSAINFIVYCTFGQKFRKQLFEMIPVPGDWICCCRKCRNSILAIKGTELTTTNSNTN